MSNMVTRCPQCQTAFKVTEEHLKIANGAVRCGSCLHVFQARQHWVKPESVQAPAKPAPAATQTTAASVAIPPAAPAMPSPPPEPVAPPAATGSHKKLEEIGDDDRISDDMALDDDEPEIVPPRKPGTASAGAFGTPDDDYSSLFDEISDDGDGFEELETGDFNDLDELVEGNAVDESGPSTADESWAKDMLAEISKEDAPPPVDLSKVDDIRDILTDFTNPVDVDAARRDLGIDSDMARQAEGGAKPLPGLGREALLAHIEPPPVELHVGRQHTAVDWKSVLRWYGAAAALALLLVVQFVGFRFNQLARNDATRPYLQMLCGVLPCEVPAVENWRYIKVSNLVVRQHPTVKDGLAIDAILLNVTRRELPFPKLDFFFSDMVKLPVASRRFEPAEYLSGELTGMAMMPPGRPVHIALEIVNPGPDAVNWHMQVAGKTE